MEDDDDFGGCHICGDMSDSCDCIDEDDEESDISWFTDPEEGAK